MNMLKLNTLGIKAFFAFNFKYKLHCHCDNTTVKIVPFITD